MMARRYPWNKRLSWRLEYLGYLLMESVLAVIPPVLIDRLGSGIGFLFFYLSPAYRRLAIRNLRIAFGKEKTRAEIELLARQTCQRTIANFLGTLKTSILPQEQINEHVAFLGKDFLNDALAGGKGAILVLGHMGNWEILNRLHQVLPPGILAGGIYQPLKNPLVDELLLRRREQDGSRMFSKRDGFHAPASFVQEGGLLIVVADQKVGRGGTAVPFFNRLSSLSPLPALLARKADSPVLAAGIETVAPGKWQLVFEPLGTRPDTATITAALERVIRRSPADYLWLHNRWRMDGLAPLSISSRKGKGRPQQTAPMRLLFVTRDEPQPAILASYQTSRSSGDLPLSLEWLSLSDSPFLTDANADLPVHHMVSPTIEQLAARIRNLDETQAAPIEGVILLEDDKDLQQAAALAHVPKVIVNRKGLPLNEFLVHLTQQPSEE